MNIFLDILELLGLIHAATPTPARVVPDPLPPRWIGVDRKNIPKTAANVGDTAWLATLMDHSNLRLCGAYLEGPALTGHTNAEFTSSTRDLARAWIPNVNTLESQGWGTAFFYVGHSIGGGEPLPSALTPSTPAGATARAARGTLHAQHAKTIVSAIGHQGAVVIFDNEDGTGTDVTRLKDYYTAFFNELERPGPGTAPALRIGLYAHNPIAASFLPDRPDLFVWEVTFDINDPGVSTSSRAPFRAADDPLQVNAATPESGRASSAKLNAMSVAVGTGARRMIYPLGRQFRSYTGIMPAGAPLSGVAGFTAQGTWDFNSSLVRDPCYPEAEPRFAAAPGPIVVRGNFTARAAGGGNPPQMTLERIDTARAVITLPAAMFVEPDAPLASASFPGTTRIDYATILTSGDIASFNVNGGTWSALASISTAPSMRRLRAFAMAAFAANDLQLFFAGPDLHLYGIRQVGGGAWSAPAVMGASPPGSSVPGVVLHTFSRLAAAVRAGVNVNLFSIDQNECLNTAWWDAGTPTFPGANSMPLEPTASLFKGTAIAAVSPEPNKIFTFGVGRDMQIRYWEWTNGTGWTGPTALGAAGDLVCPHTRLAVFARSAGRVEVAALTDDGNVIIFVLTVTAGVWSFTGTTVITNPPAIAPPGTLPTPPTALVEPAFGWRVNPHADIGIVADGTDTIVFVAGVRSGESKLLCYSTASNIWELYR